MCCGSIKNTKTEDDSLVVHFDTESNLQAVSRPPEFHPKRQIQHFVSTFADGCFQKIGGFNPQNGWFISWKTLLKWMIWGENPLFLETPRCFFYFLD